MLREYTFKDLMDRLTSDKWTVVQYGRGEYVFMPAAYKGRRL